MKLIAVTDDRLTAEQLVETINVIEPYIDAVILREKSKTAYEIIHLIQTLVDRGIEPSKLVVHGRVDIAAIVGIQKIQLPGHGLPLSLAKEHFPFLSFGRSVHSFAEAKIAVDAGADWLVYGHLFETGSKKGLPPRGTEELSRIIKSMSVPVYAIGGIMPEHIEQLQTLGIAGIAVMSSIFGSTDPVDTVKSYKERFS